MVFILPAVISLLLLVIVGMNTVYTTRAYVPAKEVVLDTPDGKIGIARKEIFIKLERPQVIFDHRRHSEAHKKEGCQLCHPLEGDRIIFDFFKTEGKDKKSVMNTYHDRCIGCHKEKNTGPVTCGECHKKSYRSLKVKYPVFEFDFYYHDLHVRKLKNDCSLCHHTYDIESSKLVYKKGTEESCYYCHSGKSKSPALALVTDITEKKNLTIKRVSHVRCLNCHLKDEKAGPTDCSGCHKGEYRAVTELENIPRPNRGQPKMTLLDIEGAKMKSVPFDHGFHEKNVKTCRVCHHEALRSCRSCHDITGKPEGGMINVATAYHSVSFERSCIGCHNIRKSEKDCAGCHHVLPSNLVSQKSCAICHAGKKTTVSPISVSKLEKVKKEVEIRILEREYEPVKFPHLDVIRKLVDISRGSKLATYFHRKTETVCEGCHHRSPFEAKKGSPPPCRNCHPIAYDPEKLNRTRLLSAYHQQCLGCHEKMELEKGRKCTDCHKEKTTTVETVKNTKKTWLVR